MSLLVRHSRLLSRVDRRAQDRLRGSRRFRLGVELLEDRVTPSTVTQLSPAFGVAAGGTVTMITGTGFAAGATVDFGTTPAASETFISVTSISATSPAGTGTVNVTVTVSGQTSPITTADEFTYAPTVTGLSPTSGPASGGTAVTIIGSGFTGATAVDFGSAPATNVQVVSDSSLTVVSPPGSGVVDVTVKTPAGSSTTSPADQFTYPTLPAVSGVSPSSGPAAGGTPVTISGSGFTGATVVDFGTNPATAVTVVDNSEITAVSPAGTGVVNVTVVAPGGTSLSSPSNQFTYGPAVADVSPRTGPAAGGTVVYIGGTGLANPISVDFGATPATDIVNASATLIEVVSPAGSGVVDVTVTTALGTSTTSATDLFFYTAPGVPAPTVTAISPTAGPPTGGTSVTITGTGFDLSGPTAVFFGSTAATNVNVVNTTTITAQSPAGTGTVDVSIINQGGSSATSPADQFSYGPTVTGISPRSGPITGGTEVVITGVNLNNPTAISFGSAGVTTLISESPTQLVVLSPQGTAFGPVDVTVSTAGGLSATSSADQFFYSAPGAVTPRVTGISPRFGSPNGGTLVTITGSGFDTSAPAAVYFGSTASTDVTVVNSSTITAVSPPAGVGTVSVTVITFGGSSISSPTSSASDAGQFTYVVDGPQVTNVLRYGFHAQPTSLVISFNAALDPAPAQKASNYLIVGPGGKRIRVRSAIYNSATDAVTLVLAQRLNLTKTYRLTINGTAPSGLTDTDGLLLDGAGTGEPGSNFVTSITRGNLAGSASQRPVAAVVKAHARLLLQRLKLSLHRH